MQVELAVNDVFCSFRKIGNRLIVHEHDRYIDKYRDWKLIFDNTEATAVGIS